jgi:hypothetical protein
VGFGAGVLRNRLALPPDDNSDAVIASASLVMAFDVYARALVRVQVRSGDLPEDVVVHSVYHHAIDTGGVLLDFDWNGHATNVANAFSHGHTGGSYTPFGVYNGRDITVKTYDLADDEPRPVKGSHHIPVGTWESGTLGPREVAMCMRYFGPRNLPSQRGRLFIGPWLQTALQETVNVAFSGQLLNLGEALGAIGSVNTSWVLASTKPPWDVNYHTTSGAPSGLAFHDITEVWVNDQWAHMTSRERAEATRWTTPISPGIP